MPRFAHALHCITLNAFAHFCKATQMIRRNLADLGIIV
jgi:hypothetical protein